MRVSPPPYDKEGNVDWDQYLLRSSHEAAGSRSLTERMRALHSSRLFQGARLHLPPDHSLNRWLPEGKVLRAYAALPLRHALNASFRV